MCLIAYVPQGAKIPREIFIHAGNVNRDGLGVMSTEGIRKFFGRKALRRARKYSAELSGRDVVHAVHWRYATHGAVTESLCHPFTTPNGNAHVMHNGILHATAADATPDKSDTALYVERMLFDAPEILTPGAESQYWGAVAEAIGSRNRMVILTGSTFYLLNEDAGLWLDGVWYSNDYSLPRAASAYDWCGTCYRDEDQCTCDATGTDSYAVPPTDNTPGDTWRYADGKRYNPVTFRWEWPNERKAPLSQFATWQEYLRKAFPLDIDDKPLDDARLSRLMRDDAPSGPTLDGMLPSDKGGYYE